MPAPPPGSRRQPRVTPGSCSSAVGDARGAHGRSTSLSASPRHRRRVQTERRSKYPSRPGGVRFALHLRVSPCVSPGPLSRGNPGRRIASHTAYIHTHVQMRREPDAARGRSGDDGPATPIAIAEPDGTNAHPTASFEPETRGVGLAGSRDLLFLYSTVTPRARVNQRPDER